MLIAAIGEKLFPSVVAIVECARFAGLPCQLCKELLVRLVLSSAAVSVGPVQGIAILLLPVGPYGRIVPSADAECP